MGPIKLWIADRPRRPPASRQIKPWYILLAVLLGLVVVNVVRRSMRARSRRAGRLDPTTSSDATHVDVQSPVARTRREGLRGHTIRSSVESLT
jgi:hypothetical protein